MAITTVTPNWDTMTSTQLLASIAQNIYRIRKRLAPNQYMTRVDFKSLDADSVSNPFTVGSKISFNGIIFEVKTGIVNIWLNSVNSNGNPMFQCSQCTAPVYVPIPDQEVSQLTYANDSTADQQLSGWLYLVRY
jgi:hypothetical protein